MLIRVSETISLGTNLLGVQNPLFHTPKVIPVTHLFPDFMPVCLAVILLTQIRCWMLQQMLSGVYYLLWPILFLMWTLKKRWMSHECSSTHTLISLFLYCQLKRANSKHISWTLPSPFTTIDLSCQWPIQRHLKKLNAILFAIFIPTKWSHLGVKDRWIQSWNDRVMSNTYHIFFSRMYSTLHRTIVMLIWNIYICNNFISCHF